MADWPRWKIRQALAIATPPVFTFHALDRRAGLSPGACAAAVTLPHEAAEAAIAKALRLKPQKIWPSRYAPDGRRLKPQPPENYKPSRVRRSCQKSEAA